MKKLIIVSILSLIFSLNTYSQRLYEEQALEVGIKSINNFREFLSLKNDAKELLEKIQKALPNAQISLVGEMRRACPIINMMEFLIASDEPIDAIFELGFLNLKSKEANHFVAKNENEKPVTIFTCAKNEFGATMCPYLCQIRK